ncbi:MAG TPA: MBL fold metallo-hydrolase [Stellaceae bacterium]|nr:MBL fold metallo-hydrolase [Stellaceae bacterium]
MANPNFAVRFWGVRGSIACPGTGTARYGGNTSCVEMRCGDHELVFDGGSGLRGLGEALVARSGATSVDLFYSHTHLDHVIGLPFFAPCYDRNSQIRIWAGHLKPERGIEEVLDTMMSPPLFPIPLAIFTARLSFLDFVAGESLVPHPGIEVRTGLLNHPNRATGYRVEYAGKVVAYITDTEHKPGKRDENVLHLVDHADLMIYDCTYTDREYPAHRDWGHSTWQEGVRLAEAANVGRLVIYHHDPDHDDNFMDRIAAAAEKRRPGTVVAKEGLVLRP